MLAEGGECGVTSHPAKYKVLVFHNLSLFLSFNQATCYSDVSVVLNVPHGFRKTITKDLALMYCPSRQTSFVVWTTAKQLVT